jgi:hypothetical protein
MLLAVTCNCLCYSMEQLTDGRKYVHCVALVMPQNIINRGIRDVHHEPLQVFLYGLVVDNNYSCYDISLSLPLDRGLTQRAVRSHICIIKDNLISHQIKNIKNIFIPLKITKTSYKQNVLLTYVPPLGTFRKR